MKKLWGLLFIATTLTAKELPEVKVIIPIIDVTIEKSEELFNGRCPDVAILCEEGTKLPVKFLGSYGLFSVKYVPNLTIQVDKTFYLRYVGNKVYVSDDLIHWSKNPLKGTQLDASIGVNQDRSGLTMESRLLDLLKME